MKTLEVKEWDVYDYDMIDYHADITNIVNEFLKDNNINYQLNSQSFGDKGDFRIEFKFQPMEV